MPPKSTQLDQAQWLSTGGRATRLQRIEVEPVTRRVFSDEVALLLKYSSSLIDKHWNFERNSHFYLNSGH